jgi:prepilin-type N-terminal cleavage/methylation domain-containing protein
MSDSTELVPERLRRDRGMTLPELLVSITIMGLIVTVLATAITVTLRQQSSTEGRLNVARSEQSVGLWMPADLSSADEVITDPTASPCGAQVCPDGIDLSNGSNVVMMTWTVDTDHHGNGFLTNVSYHFTPSAEGETYELWRVECVRPYTKDANGDPVLSGGWTCHKLTALRDLAGPPNDIDGNPVDFVPGVTSPTWVIRVSEPLAPEAIAGPDAEGPTADPTDQSQWKDANRVIVTIDGGGATAGAGGGRNQISITAGGTSREDIGATSMVGAPSFAAARSRCGGPITLVIDESVSIGETNIATVREAVREFIDALRGTPVQVQIITFTEYSRVLGASSSEWHKTFDMTDPAQADALYSAAGGIQMKGANPGGTGYTNWEEALYRVGFNKDGTIAEANMPHTVVFFTDGVPTQDRTNYKTPNTQNPVGWPVSGDPEYPLLNPSGWSNLSYSSANLNQVAYNRAEWLARQLRGKTDFIGVGVGAINNTDRSSWRHTRNGSTSQQLNKDILADLITGDVIIPGTGGNVAPIAQLGTLPNGELGYLNPDTARLYVPDWNLLPMALKTVALGECAGTITFQTRLAVADENGAYPYLDEPIRYLAEKATNPDGTSSPEEQKYAETNIANTAKNMGLSITNGSYLDVEMVPLYFSSLTAEGYSTNRWECTVAGKPVTTLQTVPSSHPSWFGFALRIQANGAASCTHFVNPPS